MNEFIRHVQHDSKNLYALEHMKIGDDANGDSRRRRFRFVLNQLLHADACCVRIINVILLCLHFHLSTKQLFNEMQIGIIINLNSIIVWGLKLAIYVYYMNLLCFTTTMFCILYFVRSLRKPETIWVFFRFCSASLRNITVHTFYSICEKLWLTIPFFLCVRSCNFW